MNKTTVFFTDTIKCADCGKVCIHGYYLYNNKWVCVDCLKTNKESGSPIF